MIDADTKTVNLLVVDDDEVDLLTIKRGFRKLRLANPIFIARNGVEALAQMRGSDGTPRVPEPRIVLLDLKMPMLDGLETLREIRADPELQNSVVFLLTTSRLEEDRAAAYDLHVNGYVVKDRLGDDFIDLVMMLKSFWRIVELPIN